MFVKIYTYFIKTFRSTKAKKKVRGSGNPTDPKNIAHIADSKLFFLTYAVVMLVNPVIHVHASYLGRKDLCSHCANPDGRVNDEQKKKFKTVLPICDECMNNEKTPFTQRPYA